MITLAPLSVAPHADEPNEIKGQEKDKEKQKNKKGEKNTHKTFVIEIGPSYCCFFFFTQQTISTKPMFGFNSLKKIHMKIKFKNHKLLGEHTKKCIQLQQKQNKITTCYTQFSRKT
jgi:hypothetical protein